MAENEMIETGATDSSGLTPMQAAFVRAVAVECMTQTKAAEAAGYSHPSSRAVELVRQPHILAAIQTARQAIINTDLAALGLRTMRELMSDSATPAPVRFQAAKWSLETAGHKDVPTSQQAQAEKQLHEMSVEELEAFIQRGESALQGMKRIGGTIELSAQDSAQG